LAGRSRVGGRGAAHRPRTRRTSIGRRSQSANNRTGAVLHAFPRSLLAIAAGAVFMGANTYIGNAPNFMVRAIAQERGIPMPSF